MKRRRCSLRVTSTRTAGAENTPRRRHRPCKEESLIEVGESRPAWEALEAYAREGIRHLLEEEREEVVGRRRYERREGVDAPPGYRNGFGKPRRLSLVSGTITVRRPRGWGLGARFDVLHAEPFGDRP
jgi:hypothetical protein